jgi:5-methyltetrahydrofolate--homocysteine methyltransferase
VLIGGAAINRAFSYRTLHVDGLDEETLYGPGVFYCKDAFEGLGVMDKIVEADDRAELLSKLRADADAFRVKGEEIEVLDTSQTGRSELPTDNPVPEPPFWGVREIPVDLDEVYSHLDTHVLFKLHWGGKGVKGEAWKQLVDGTDEDEGFRPRLERMWHEQTYLHPRALLGYFPCYSEGNEIVVLDPDDRETELQRLYCPRQPGNAHLSAADLYRSKESGELDVIGLQVVTVGDEVTELMAKLEADGEFAEQLYVHGLGVQTAEGLAEWLHYKVREDLGIPVTQGRRYSWGYPAVPEQSEHEKVDALLDLSRIGMTLSDGYAPVPEQSTLAMIAHHPYASYFTMKQGRILSTPDDIIKGSKRDPSLFAEADAEELDTDPIEGGVAEDDDARVAAQA